ncbi:MAG TPA: hypothetical protein VGP94_07340 [Tepidisphaeraceae bacterium]|nr:hypothetical protein [Tepidisphaeraceae bacterium]
MASPWFRAVFAGIVILAAGTILAQVKPENKAPVAEWKQGEKVEVKWGGLWSAASIVNRRGEWYLVEYAQGRRREWVEHWRIRKVGDTQDAIGYARPNPVWKPGDNPPRERAGEPPSPNGAAGTDPAEAAKQLEAIKNNPAFKEADWSAAKDADLRPQTGVFKILPDAAPKGPNLRPIRMAKIREGAASLRRIFFSRGAGNFAAAIHEYSPPGAPEEVWLEKIDLAAGKSAAVFELKEKMLSRDISADGKLVALRNDVFGSGNSTRLELWAIDGQQFKKLLILFPYEQEKYAPDRDIADAWILDAGHVLTINTGGKLALWDVATGKAIYKAQLAKGARPEMSSGGRQLAAEIAGAMLIIDPMTAAVLGSLPLEGESGLRCSFSPSGKQLAAWGSRSIYAWDLESGKLFREFSISVGAGVFEMVSDGYALLDNHILIDFERRIPLWEFNVGGRLAGAVAPSGIFWYTVQSAQGNSSLTPLRLPTAEALAGARKLKAEDLLLLKPGVKVALSINVDASEPERGQIETALKNQIAQNKLVLDDSAPIRITASTEQGKSEEKQYRSINQSFFGPAQKVTVTEMITRLSIEVNGQKAWEARTFSLAGGFLRLKEGQTLEQAIAEAARPNYAFLKTTRIPAYLTKPRMPAWYGSSRLDAGR